MPTKYSIKDLERVSGIKAHTLRIWEQRYEILNPERTETNIRYYSNADLKRILNISLLNNNGYKISNIAKLSDENLVQEVEKFLGSYKDESHQIDNLVLCLMDMDEFRFESTINNSIQHFGFENTIEKVVFPFLRHMGNMWLTGLITPAQEHYISNLVRQKIIVGIDSLKGLETVASKRFLFFLPSLELHEMGLLYAHYLAKAQGHKCFYLGQSVPFEDLITITKNAKPDFIVCILTAALQDTTLNEFLYSCNSQIEGPEFLMSGRLLVASDEKYRLPSPRFHVFNDFADFKKLL
jgi:DNA-binding transcriptional MerR regulator